VSLLILLDLQSITLFLVFVFLVLFVLVVYFQFCFYTQKTIKMKNGKCYRTC
jgi:hypothetical protein